MPRKNTLIGKNADIPRARWGTPKPKTNRNGGASKKLDAIIERLRRKAAKVRKVPRADVERMHELAASGLPCAAIAQRLGWSRSAVHVNLSRSGFDFRKGYSDALRQSLGYVGRLLRPDQHDTDIRRWSQHGKRTVDIAEALCVSPAWVYKRRKAMGLPLPPRHGGECCECGGPSGNAKRCRVHRLMASSAVKRNWRRKQRKTPRSRWRLSF